MTGVDILLIVSIAIIFICFYFAITFIGNHSLKGFFDYKGDLKQAQPKDDRPPKKQDLENCVLIGSCQNRNVYLPCDSKHVFVCGTTGSGKTVALSNFIHTAILEDFPLLIVDGKGDTGTNSLKDIVERLKGNRKLYTIDLNNPSTSDKYNPFKNTSATVIKDMLINMTEWSEAHYKLNTERYLQRVINLLVQSDVNLSFKSIVSYLDTDKFLVLSAMLLKSDKISKEEHVENGLLAKTCGNIAKDSIARFSNLLESDVGQIFDESGIDIYTALKENAIILFILNPLMYPEVSPLFGRLITIDSKKAVSHLFTDEKNRTFFIFDEINVYASSIFLDLINKSRSACITSILACQSLSDLEAVETESFKHQIIENTNNYIVMRQNSSKNAEEWANTIGTHESMAVTYQIGDGETTKGSLRKTREFIFHPDDIKNLGTGEAFVISKDRNFKYKVKVNKPF